MGKMTINTKMMIIPIIIGIVFVIGVMYYSMSEDIQKVSEEKVGTVKGVVYFVGKPCPPSRVGPPCDGPYPDYKVIIYESDGKKIVDKIMTDDQGNFETSLSVGNYLVFEKSVDFNKIDEIPLMFTIESEKTKSIKIRIDKGIR